jgi:citrate lyase subunit beta / citryl-CoA lyase
MRASVCRSYLFVPANRIERVAKAHAAGPHAVIVDLEDAVPPLEKASAREAAARVLPDAAPVLVRVNAPETEWFEDDLALCAHLGVHGVVIPKAERTEELHLAASRLPAEVVLLPLIETARGFAAAARLCEAPRVQRVVFGSIDFQLDLGITGEGEELLHFRSGLVLASRLAGVQPPVDGVTVAIGDEAQVRSDTMRGKRLGFGGKLCIHPRQVAVVNACFQPTADELAWARRIVDAAARANGAAVQVDGKMVDRPVILKAEAILAEAEGA